MRRTGIVAITLTAIAGCEQYAAIHLADVGLADIPRRGESRGWAIGIGGTGADGAGSAVGSAVAGTIGPGTSLLGTVELLSSGGKDVFVARLGASGVVAAVRGGGQGADGGNSVAIDPVGNLYVAGWFSEKAAFGDSTLSSEGDIDGFVWKLPAPEP